MTLVAVPFIKGRVNLVVDLVRPWSIVEHVLLEELTRQPCTADVLSKDSGVTRRVVLEALIRLMRAGWVELIQEKGSVTFRATPRGARVAVLSELPSNKDRRSRNVSYLFDLVTSTVFRSKDWRVLTESEVKRRARVEPVEWMPSEQIEENLDPAKVIDVLLDEDESFVSASGSGTSRRFALVRVAADGVIENVPGGKASEALRAKILSRSTQGSRKDPTVAQDFVGPGQSDPVELIRARVESCDLVVDGGEHYAEIIRVLRQAKTMVIIHSTFVDSGRVLALAAEIGGAIDRGVRVSVFWGQDEQQDPEISASQASVATLLRDATVQSWGDKFSLHPFSTGSHAKFLIADSGEDGCFEAVLGSCNWLSSGFVSFEVSIRVSAPRAIERVLRHLAGLVALRGGVWTPLSTELVRLGRALQAGGETGGESELALVLGANHSAYVLRARDEAKSRIVVASHRLGAVALPGVLTPLAVAVQVNDVSASVLYCRKTAPVTKSNEKSLLADAEAANLSVRSLSWPRLHAKFLAWDRDNVVVTSLNWLSADPGDETSAKELGIWIRSPGIADALLERVEAVFPLGELR